MAVSLLITLSRRLQAPIAALLIAAALQLMSGVVQAGGPAKTPTTHVRGALAAAVHTAPERS